MHGTLRHDTSLACSRAPKPVRVRRAHQGAATTPPPLPSPSHDATRGPYRCFSSIAFHLSPASPASPSTCPLLLQHRLPPVPGHHEGSSRRSHHGDPNKDIPSRRFQHLTSPHPVPPPSGLRRDPSPAPTAGISLRPPSPPTLPLLHVHHVHLHCHLVWRAPAATHPAAPAASRVARAARWGALFVGPRDPPQSPARLCLGRWRLRRLGRRHRLGQRVGRRGRLARRLVHIL